MAWYTLTIKNIEQKKKTPVGLDTLAFESAFAFIFVQNIIDQSRDSTCKHAISRILGRPQQKGCRIMDTTTFSWVLASYSWFLQVRIILFRQQKMHGTKNTMARIKAFAETINQQKCDYKTVLDKFRFELKNKVIQLLRLCEANNKGALPFFWKFIFDANPEGRFTRTWIS